MRCFGATVTIQRVGSLGDLTFITERIVPVIGNPSNINVAVSPLYWA
jgi:hypothetical protein